MWRKLAQEKIVIMAVVIPAIPRYKRDAIKVSLNLRSGLVHRKMCDEIVLIIRATIGEGKLFEIEYSIALG